MADLVLVPGLNNTGAVFAGVLPHLPAEIRAHAPTNPPFERVEEVADALLEILPPRFWLGGFSFGGYVALAMLERARERVQGLALVCTDSGADTDAQRVRRRELQQRAADGEYPAMLEAQLPNTFHTDSLAKPELMAARRAMVQDYGAQRFIAHLEAVMHRPDRSSLLQDPDLPVLFVSAEADVLFPPAAVAGRAAQVPGARHVSVAGAGHLLPMEQPAELARVLVDWMSESPS